MKKEEEVNEKRAFIRQAAMGGVDREYDLKPDVSKLHLTEPVIAKAEQDEEEKVKVEPEI